MYLNITKPYMTSPELTSYCDVESEKLKAFALKSETRQGYPLTTFIQLEVLARAIRHEKKKRYSNQKRKLNCVFRQHDFIHRKTLKTPPKSKLLELTHKFNKVEKCKIYKINCTSIH